MHDAPPRRRAYLRLARILLGLLALAAGGLALCRPAWLEDALESLLLPQPAAGQAEHNLTDVPRNIPGIDHLATASADEADLDEDAPVLGVSAGGRSRAYLVEAFATGPGSHIVNDILGGVPVSITHCDRTGCSRAFTDDGLPGRQGRPLALSGGGLKRSHMVLYTGGHAYEQDTVTPLDPSSPPFPYRAHRVERTSWGDWRKAHPDTDVYLGTVSPGESISSEPTAPSQGRQHDAGARAPLPALGPSPVGLGASALLLLTGAGLLLPRPRRVARLLLVLPLLVGLAVLVPGSPVSVPVLLEHSGGYHEGHGTRYWLRALASPDAGLRRKAVVALGIIGPRRPEVVPALACILSEDPDSGARQQAALALVKMGTAARAALPELAGALADEHPAVRMNVAVVLVRLGAEARPAVPALIEAIERKENRTNLGTFASTIREMAALALGRASSGTSVGVPTLTRALKAARSTQARVTMARALGEVGAPARPALPHLRTLLSEKETAVREAAAEALQKIEGEAGERNEG